jgi:hypothetical protein
MRFKTQSGTSYDLTFSFDAEAPTTTICTLRNITKGRTSFGKAALSRKDTFNKAIGRKTALAAAIKNFKRENRQEIWNCYNAKKNFREIQNQSQ